MGNPQRTMPTPIRAGTGLCIRISRPTTAQKAMNTTGAHGNHQPRTGTGMRNNVDAMGAMSIATGSGDDTIALGDAGDAAGLFFGAAMTITAGGGNDDVGIYQVVAARSMKVDLGLGDDTLTASGGTFEDATTLLGGTGSNTLDYLSGGNVFILPAVIKTFKTIQ